MPVVIAVAVAAGACGGLSADSSCREYVSASRDAQVAATQKVAQETGSSYNPLVQANVDNVCSVNPDGNLRLAVSGVSADPDGGDGGGPQALSPGATCQEYIDAPDDVRQATAGVLKVQKTSPTWDGLTEVGVMSFLDDQCQRDSKRGTALRDMGGLMD